MSIVEETDNTVQASQQSAPREQTLMYCGLVEILEQAWENGFHLKVILC